LERDVANLASDASVAELRATFTEWAEAEAGVKVLADAPLPNGRGSVTNGDSVLSRDREGAVVFVAELLPLAHDLAMVGNIGLRALDYIERREPAPAGWLAEQNQELDRLEQPVAEVRLAGVRPVRLLLARANLQSLAKSSVRCGNEPICNSRRTVRNWTLTAPRPNITLE